MVLFGYVLNKLFEERFVAYGILGLPSDCHFLKAFTTVIKEIPAINQHFVYVPKVAFAPVEASYNVLLRHIMAALEHPLPFPAHTKIGRIDKHER